MHKKELSKEDLEQYFLQHLYELNLKLFLDQGISLWNVLWVEKIVVTEYESAGGCPNSLKEQCRRLLQRLKGLPDLIRHLKK